MPEEVHRSLVLSRGASLISALGCRNIDSKFLQIRKNIQTFAARVSLT